MTDVVLPFPLDGFLIVPIGEVATLTGGLSRVRIFWGLLSSPCLDERQPGRREGFEKEGKVGTPTTEGSPGGGGGGRDG